MIDIKGAQTFAIVVERGADVVSTASILLSTGSRLVLLGPSLAHLESAKDTLAKMNGDWNEHIIFHAVDVSRDSEVEKILRRHSRDHDAISAVIRLSANADAPVLSGVAPVGSRGEPVASTYYPEDGVIQGLHRDRVAVITGGSEGIGGAISRQLALSGVMIVIAERNGEKLDRIREQLAKEMAAFDIPDAANRIYTMANCDVTNEESLKDIIAKTIERFGRVDFLINNAGLVGAEEMMVDIPPETWNQTVYGNLTSNYQLLLLALPEMKRQGYGHIINMSSYFGGDRHGAVPYTNRADYAVSKGGQIALVQALMRALGPDVQINALAPGPVNGARLNGTGGRPGLYQRRAKLLMENQRLNQVYRAAVRSLRTGHDCESILQALCLNEIEGVANNEAHPAPIRELARSILSGSKRDLSESSSTHLLPSALFAKLVKRLHRSGRLTNMQMPEQILAKFAAPPEPFFDPEKIERRAVEIRDRMIGEISLKRMPTDRALACEVACSLAHRTMTGEVIYPTCGFQYDGGDLGPTFRSFGSSMTNVGFLEQEGAGHRMKDKVAFIFANSMFTEVAELASRFQMAKRTVIVTYSKSDANSLKALLKTYSNVSVVYHESKMGLASSFDEVAKQFGAPNAVFSFPMGGVPGDKSNEEAYLPSMPEFKEMIENHITSHFLLSQKAAMVENCRVVLVTPSLKTQATRAQVIWVKFIRQTLRPLTLCAGKESSFVHDAIFYQVGSDDSDELFYTTLTMMASEPIATARAEKRPDASSKAG